MAREGTDKPLNFDIVRDEIPRYSVEEAFWVRPGIAYMHISAFNENTSQEMEDNLKKLGETNIKGLVLDLRNNPGGLLNEGVAVAGHYLRNCCFTMAVKAAAAGLGGESFRRTWKTVARPK